jgi:hypothetical protein
MSYPEDLGMQTGPMLSPKQFRRYIKPVYQKLMKPARERDCIVHMHSDGDIRTLVDDLIDGGVEVINLQDLVNGIDWIAGKFAGHICVDLDIDRQQITARGTPRQINDLIRGEVEKISRCPSAECEVSDGCDGEVRNILLIEYSLRYYS